MSAIIPVLNHAQSRRKYVRTAAVLGLALFLLPLLIKLAVTEFAERRAIPMAER